MKIKDKVFEPIDLVDATGGMTPEEIGGAIANAVTSEGVNNIVVLTQAQYDALTPADDVMYVIVE